MPSWYFILDFLSGRHGPRGPDRVSRSGHNGFDVLDAFRYTLPSFESVAALVHSRVSVPRWRNYLLQIARLQESCSSLAKCLSPKSELEREPAWGKVALSSSSFDNGVKFARKAATLNADWYCGRQAFPQNLAEKLLHPLVCLSTFRLLISLDFLPKHLSFIYDPSRHDVTFET